MVENFELNPEYWQNTYYERGIVHKKYYGEQNYVCMMAKQKFKLKKLPGKILYKKSNDFRRDLELQKIYCKKFKTDYAIMGEAHKYIKIIHFAGPDNKIKDI